MCRSIKPLRKETEWTDEDVRASALQYIRKLSGYRVPAEKNKDVFERAVEEVYATTRAMLMEFAPEHHVEEHSHEWIHANAPWMHRDHTHD